MFIRGSSTQMYNLCLGKSLSRNFVGTEEVSGQYRFPLMLFVCSFPKLPPQEGWGKAIDLVWRSTVTFMPLHACKTAWKGLWPTPSQQNHLLRDANLCFLSAPCKLNCFPGRLESWGNPRHSFNNVGTKRRYLSKQARSGQIFISVVEEQSPRPSWAVWPEAFQGGTVQEGVWCQFRNFWSHALLSAALWYICMLCK